LQARVDDGAGESTPDMLLSDAPERRGSSSQRRRGWTRVSRRLGAPMSKLFCSQVGKLCAQGFESRQTPGIKPGTLWWGSRA